MVELYEQNIFEEIEEVKHNFEVTFQERRSIALYKLNKEKNNQNSN